MDEQASWYTRRPEIRVRGKRIWYAPWRREPDRVYLGMSPEMVQRAQNAQMRAFLDRMPVKDQPQG